ncbi:MAG: DNA glycosylase AlkZ-like family protein, partial [Planctomycetota bacterium]
RSPFEGARLPADPIDLWARLGEIFFRAAGLGTLKGFSEWAGISQSDATAAAGRLPLAPVTIEGVEETHLLLEPDRRALLEPRGTDGAVSFLPFEDNLLALRGGPSILVDPAFHGLRVPVWGGKEDKLGAVRTMSFRSIVAEGRVVGFWEFDPKPGTVVVACFDKVKPPTRKRIDAEAAEVGAFITREFGHGKSFSIDSDEELSKRAAALAAIGR